MVSNILSSINNYVWGWGLIFILLFTGIFYTIKLGFLQLRLIPFLSGRKDSKKSENGISQLKTVTSSLGTAMGTGNIVGVASAIAIGGAGSIFWMWVSAFLGMALVYAENYLGILYRREEDGEWLGGAVSYIKYGAGSDILAVIFSVFCVFASWGMGGMVQANSIGNALSDFGTEKYLTAIILFVTVFAVISGGIKRIGSASQIIIPVLTGIYIIVSLIIIFRHRENLGRVFADIFESAFDFKSAGGFAVSVGIRRGIFSNEAGLGSSSIMHSASEEDSPYIQGMWSMFEVFLDTIVCCTLTALVLLLTDTYDINTAFGGNIFIDISIILFAFCTITGWYYCGETSFRHISGGRYIKPYRFIFAVIVSLGAVFSPENVWTVSDIFNGLMAVPNILALLLLFRKVRI